MIGEQTHRTIAGKHSGGTVVYQLTSDKLCLQNLHALRTYWHIGFVMNVIQTLKHSEECCVTF